MEFLRTCYQVSTRRAAQTLNAPRATLYNRSRKPEQTTLRHRIKEIAAVRVRYGYRRIHTLLQREGWAINHKRIYRLYCLEGLQMRHKPPRRRVSAKLREDRTDATRPNQCWCMDFMADELFDGRRLRLLTSITVAVLVLTGAMMSLLRDTSYNLLKTGLEYAGQMA